MKKAFPLGRWGQPQDVVNMILFLCLDEASFLTGTVYLVDGGYAAGKEV
jgi:2-keto-3-deoxy-L-fuconate dehydrogenase